MNCQSVKVPEHGVPHGDLDNWGSRVDVTMQVAPHVSCEYEKTSTDDRYKDGPGLAVRRKKLKDREFQIPLPALLLLPLFPVTSRGKA